MSTDNRRYASLEEAFKDKNFPEANLEFVQTILSGIDVDYLYDGHQVIQVVRKGDKRNLRINAGYTAGFATESEAKTRGKGARVWTPDDRPKDWSVDHPDLGGARDSGICEHCHQKRSASGACSC